MLFRSRQKKDFAALLPFLRQTIDLKKRYVDCFTPSGDPYDVLLDDFERGMPTSEVRAIFDRLKSAIVPLIAAVAARGPVADVEYLPFPRLSAGVFQWRGKPVHRAGVFLRHFADRKDMIRTYRDVPIALCKLYSQPDYIKERHGSDLVVTIEGAEMKQERGEQKRRKRIV